MAKSSRLGWLDAVRSIAICTVVLIHCAEGLFAFNLENVAAASVSARALYFTAFVVGRLGVPLFLMSSGWLLLERDYTAERIRDFYRRSWLPLLAVTEFWNVLYLLFLTLVMHRHYTPVELVLQLLFLKGSGMNHLWYMPMILGWYLVIPVLGRGLRGLELETLRLPLWAALVYGFAAPVINIWFMSNTESGLTNFLMPGLHEGGFYGLYLILGWMVRRGAFRRCKSWVLALCVPLGLAASEWMMWYSYDHAYQYNLRYNLGALALAAVCLFELFSRLDRWQAPAAVTALALYAFPVYLTHNPIRMLLQPAAKKIRFLPLRLAALYLPTLALAILCAWAVSRIPKVGRKALYMK